jgi:hypothetical protein
MSSLFNSWRNFDSALLKLGRLRAGRRCRYVVEAREAPEWMRNVAFATG